MPSSMFISNKGNPSRTRSVSADRVAVPSSSSSIAAPARRSLFVVKKRRAVLYDTESTTASALKVLESRNSLSSKRQDGSLPLQCTENGSLELSVAMHLENTLPNSKDFPMDTRSLSDIFKEAFADDDEDDDYVMTPYAPDAKQVSLSGGSVIGASGSFFEDQYELSTACLAASSSLSSSAMIDQAECLTQPSRNEAPLNIVGSEAQADDLALFDMFNMWDLLDYERYLSKLEHGTTQSIRRNNTWLSHGESCERISQEYYDQIIHSQPHSSEMPLILIDKLPIPDDNMQFCGDVYLLGYDINSEELFVRRFLQGLPSDLTQLPSTWSNGKEVYRFTVDRLIGNLVTSLQENGDVQIDRLHITDVCNEHNLTDTLGMEMVIVIRFTQWVVDFVEALFSDDEDELVDMLETIYKRLGLWRRVLKRASADAWRACENRLSKGTYSEKLLVNQETVSNIYTLGKMCRYSKEFLDGSAPRPRQPHAPDCAWLGNFRRQIDSTPERVKRGAQQLSQLFEPPVGIPLSSNPFAMLVPPPVVPLPAAIKTSTVVLQSQRPALLQAIARARLASPWLERRSGSALLAVPETWKIRTDMMLRSNAANGQGPLSRLDHSSSISKGLATSLLWGLVKSSEPTTMARNVVIPGKMGRDRRAVMDPACHDSAQGEDTAMVQKSLPGLVQGLQQLVAQAPEIDNTLARRKLGAILADLKQEAERQRRGERHDQGSQDRQCDVLGDDDDRKVEAPHGRSWLQFARNWF